MPADAGTTPREPRRFGRLRCQDVECSAGEVVDISAGGMRIRCKNFRPPEGRPFGITISACGSEIRVTCITRWRRKAGFLQYEAGLEFVNLSEENLRALATLARACAHNETIRYQYKSA